MWDRGYRGPLAHLAMGAVDLARRDVHSAMEHFKEAERINPRNSNLHVLIGWGLLRLQEWESAERAFARALEINSDNEDAFDGMACAALGRGNLELAAEHSLRAVALRNNFAEAHYHLGVALSRLNRPQAAGVAFEKALSIRPNLLAAYGRLIDLFEGPLLDERRAREFRRRADEVMLQRRMRRQSK
jgi:tetratricopeptide (TPR) repeat protein